MSNAQKVGHAQPLFTNVHAIDSFLAFPFMGIVEYVTLIKRNLCQWDRDAVDQGVYLNSPFSFSQSILPGAFYIPVHFPMHRREDMHSHYLQMFMQSIHLLHFFSWEMQSMSHELKQFLSMG